MIKELVSKLANNVELLDNEETKGINIVMSGGAFNASYMAGCFIITY